MTPKIIELIIQDGDDEAGLDGIALVELPAHEAAFEYFSDNQKPTHYVLADEEIPQVIQMFHAYGEPQGLLEKEGFTITEIRSVGKKEFAILSDPNAPSAQDTPEVKFRYKYVGPKDEKNRTFCAEMMRANRVFRIEDIMEMSDRNVNPVGPDGYDMFEWRGSYNCRHKWVQLVYRANSTIINKSSVRKGLIDEDGMPGPDTRTTATIEAGNTPPRTGFAAENPNVSALEPYVDQVTKKVERKPVLASLPMFENREDAEAMAISIGCKGSHSMTYGNVTLWMPCESHNLPGDEGHPDMYAAEKISIDYDDTLSTERGMNLAKDLIAKGAILYIISARQDKEPMLKRAEELGIPASRVYATGSNKAKVEKVKELGIIAHHDNNKDVIKELGNIGVQFGLEEACWPGYEAIGLKDNGDPNCVPINEEMSEDGNYVIGEFASFDDYPSLIRENAKAALAWIEKTGNPKGCMTQVGKVRAQQLAQGKPISIETVKRMKAYITRHKVDLESSKSYEDGCGKLAMDAWGGVEALPWVERTIAKYENMSSETEMTFSVFNNEQRLVIGPAMIPDKMIIRRNEITGEIYYVYFTAETIKKLQQKFMQEKLLDKTNIEHGRKFLDNVDVVESWIVEDQEKDKQQVFGMNYPKGTWMITMKVNDDSTWEKVKDGKLKGFSVQGYFLEKAKFSQVNNEILNEIKNILNQVQ